MSTNTISQIHIPDLLTNWPFKRSLNPAYEAIKAESENWIQSFGVLDNNIFCEKFDNAIPALLASRSYPYVSSEILRLGADLMTIFFCVDEITDALNLLQAREFVSAIAAALSSPDEERPESETNMEKVHKSFGDRCAYIGSEYAVKQFITRYSQYLDAVCQEAEDRERCLLRDSKSYMTIRRDTIGSKPSYSLLLFTLTLSDEEINHPAIVELEKLSSDMLIIGNDICSYNVEQSRGEDKHNLVTIIMHERHLSLQESIYYIAHDLEGLTRRFVEIQTLYSSKWSKDLKLYVRGLGDWVRGNYEWGFEVGRYGLGEKARRTGVVDLLPKRP